MIGNFSLVIKGAVSDAEEALARHGIEPGQYDVLSYTRRETVVAVTAEWRMVQDWFAEPTTFPAPEGALLLFTERK